MKENKFALVTGGSSGIGKEIAITLARDGFIVCINFSKSRDDAISVQEAIESFGGQSIIYQANITDEHHVQGMMSELKEKWGKLDVLVNNAGIYLPDFIETHQLSNWESILKLNLTAKLLCIKYATPLLKGSAAPRIINIASRAAIKPMEESVAYCAAAAGIVMLTKVAALELAQYGIRVNTISPGLTKTPMTEAVDDEEEFMNYAQKNPAGRIGYPSDIANLVKFLVSSAAEFINGENINVSGGITLV